MRIRIFEDENLLGETTVSFYLPRIGETVIFEDEEFRVKEICHVFEKFVDLIMEKVNYEDEKETNLDDHR